MVKDIWGQEIKNGDFVISASKSEGEMVFGVMKDVTKQTRIRVDKDYRTGKYVPHDKSSKMYTLDRTLKLEDQTLIEQNPDLFAVMNDIREQLSLPTNRELKSIKQQQDALRRMLQSTLH